MDREILLTQGKTATISGMDYDILSKLKWCARRSRAYFCAVSRTSAKLDGKQHPILMHRFVWELHNGPIPKDSQIDHINGDPLDNRIENLRLCTLAQNHYNRHAKNQACSSKFKGVCYHKAKNKWQAEIHYLGKQIYLGYFDSEEEAAVAYNKAALEYHKDFACLNMLGGEPSAQ